MQPDIHSYLHTPIVPFTFYPSIFASSFFDFFFFGEIVAFDFATLEFAKSCRLSVPSPFPLCLAVLVILMLSHKN